MGILKKKIVLTIFMTLLVTSGVGCAKLNYLYEQGMGQMALLSAGKENHEVLKSVRVPKTHKEKIKKREVLSIPNSLLMKQLHNELKKEFQLELKIIKIPGGKK